MSDERITPVEDETVEVENVDTWDAPVHPLEMTQEGGEHVDPTGEVWDREAQRATERAERDAQIEADTGEVPVTPPDV